MRKKKPAVAPAAPPPSPVQDQALGISEAERQQRDRQLQMSNDSVTEAKTISDQSAPLLDRMTVPDSTGQTPWRREQLNRRTESTTRSYDNALVAQRKQAMMSGFGYAQPIARAGENEIENERAAALARVPGDVELEALQPEFQAVGLQNQRAGLRQGLAQTQLGISGEYSPENYFSTGAGLEQQRLNIGQDEKDRFEREQERARQRRAGLWKGLATTGLNAASMFV